MKWLCLSLGLALVTAYPVQSSAEQPPPARPSTDVSAPTDRPAASPATGSICGLSSLVGSAVPAMVGEGGCAVAAPVRVEAAAGVALDPPPTLDCSAARALAGWLTVGVAPAFAARGATVAGLIVVDAYACRNRNQATTGKLSEHARGRALDVGAFRLADGSTVAVQGGWSSTDWGPVLHRVRDAACGPFSTVLGPDANALHADHLHLDTEERKRGPWCE